MMSNQLTPGQRTAARMFGQPLFARGHGYGMGVAVVMEPDQADVLRCRGGVGTVGWPGAYGSWWQADPNDGSVLDLSVAQHGGAVPAGAGYRPCDVERDRDLPRPCVVPALARIGRHSGQRARSQSRRRPSGVPAASTAYQVAGVTTVPTICSPRTESRSTKSIGSNGATALAFSRSRGIETRTGTHQVL